MQKRKLFENLMEKAGKYLPDEALGTVKRAYELVSERHPEDVEHVLHAAITVCDLQLDENCIAAALLHRFPRHGEDNTAYLEDKFDFEVLKLVEGLSKLQKISWTGEPSYRVDRDIYAESLRKMLMAMVDDIRVVFIKLACRLHSVSCLNPESRSAEAELMAMETLEVYAAIAHRLGIWEIKWQMEDMASRYIEPERFNHIAEKMQSTRLERELQVELAKKALKQELKRAGIEAEVTGRPKHIYSIMRKEEKYKRQGKTLEHIYDLLGLRILVKDVKDCYNALGVTHSIWRPLTNEFNDYIANPRGGVYQSLHTTVMASANLPLEIQIRTYEMHRIAEYGIAAHSTYKEGKKKFDEFDKKLAGLRFLLDKLQDVGGAEFMDRIQIDIFDDTVMVYTPKGDIKDLPAGATPLDFAYRVHTELGHRCVGTKVNGKMVPLSYKLKNGDTVDIIVGKTDKGPSRDWLNPELGYLHTSYGREKVRQWFRKQERKDNIEQGRAILDKELLRLGISISDEELAGLFKRESVDDFLAAIGYGDISTHQIANRLSVPKEKPIPETAPKKRLIPSGIHVMGMGNLLTQLATCCNPMRGDDIIGYITRTKGISVHRTDCPNILNTAEKERLIKVEWGMAEEVYPVPVRIEAFDRMGLLRDISTVVAEEGVNIAAASTNEQDDGTSLIMLTLQTRGLGQLSRLFSKLEGVSGVIRVTRIT